MSYGPHTRNPWEHDESEPEMVRCDACEMGMVDGDPANGVIAGKYVCARCYGELLDELRAQPVDFHDDIRR